MAQKEKDYFGADGDSIYLVGASSDPKNPFAPTGSEFCEYDTGLFYVKSPAGWRLKGGQTIVAASLDARPDPSMVPKNTFFVLAAAAIKVYCIVGTAWQEVTL